jgi:hypothetical protein
MLLRERVVRNGLNVAIVEAAGVTAVEEAVVDAVAAAITAVEVAAAMVAMAARDTNKTSPK